MGATRFLRTCLAVQLNRLIVRDMWLTGFDAPALHTMYVRPDGRPGRRLVVRRMIPP